MSIFRYINGQNNDRYFLEKKRDYITDSTKTNDGKYVGGSACCSKHELADWFSVKKIYHKSNGKQGEHVVISPSPDKKDISTQEYLTMADEFAKKLFGDYNCIYAVHIDSKYRHIHLLFNSVSYVDGKRFHSTKTELAETRLKVNNILKEHGFDIINNGTDEMIDSTPYNLADSMDYLEINNIVDDLSPEDFYDYLDGKDVIKKNDKSNKYNYCKTDEKCTDYNNYDYNESEDYEMNNNHPYANTDVSYASPNMYGQSSVTNNTPIPQINSNTSPQLISNTINNDPTLRLNFCPKINVNINSPISCEDIRNYINTTTPKYNIETCVKATYAMASKFDQNNIRMNIEANFLPEITFNIDSNYLDGNNIIDITANDFK